MNESPAPADPAGGRRPRASSIGGAGGGGGGARGAVALLATLALALRFLPYRALTQPYLRLLTVDCYGHLRRAVATVRDFPHVPVFDPFLNAPAGGVWIWPPLFDFLIALPARLLGGAAASVPFVAGCAALWPPILGALEVALLWPLARRLLGRRFGLAAVALLALLPAAVRWSVFGHADQHALEALAAVAVLASLPPLLDAVDAASSRRAIALTAGALALAVLSWQGAIFLAPLAAGVALLGGRGRLAAAAIAAAALAVTPFGFGAAGPLTYISFGAFQPLFLSLTAALTFAAAAGRRGRILAGGVAAVALAWTPLRDGILHLARATDGATIVDGGYLAYPRAWLALIGEYRPLLAGGFGFDRHAAGVWRVALVDLGPALLALPWALGIWIARWRRDRQGAALVAAVSGAAFLALTLAQSRYVYYLAPIAALAGAELVARAARRARALAVLVAVALVASAVPGLRHELDPPGPPGLDLVATLGRLGLEQPPPKDPSRIASIRPGEIEGVMAPWALGHFVTLFTGRPAAADNFGYGFFDQAELWTTPPADDARAQELLARKRCRYLVTFDLRGVLPAYAAAVGRAGAPVAQMLAVRVHESGAARPLPFLERLFDSGSVVRGAGGRLLPLLEVYRVTWPGETGSSELR